MPEPDMDVSLNVHDRHVYEVSGAAVWLPTSSARPLTTPMPTTGVWARCIVTCC